MEISGIEVLLHQNLDSVLRKPHLRKSALRILKTLVG